MDLVGQQEYGVYMKDYIRMGLQMDTDDLYLELRIILKELFQMENYTVQDLISTQ